MFNLDKVRGCMAERRDTQEDLAKILGLSTNSVNNKLNGKTPFNDREIGKIAKHYKKSAGFFFK